MQRKFIDRLLLPTIFGLTTVIAALILWQLLLGHRRVEIQAATKEQALFVKTKTESELKANILVLEQLASRWQARRQRTDEDMQSDVELAMSGYPAYQSIEWVAPSYNVLWHTPRNVTAHPTGADMNQGELTRTVLREAEAERVVVVSHPVNLGDGSKGLLICVPVYSHDKLAGFLLSAFRYPALFSPILRDVAPDYWIEIYDGGEQIYNRSIGSQPDKKWVQTADIQFQQVTWRAYAWPKPVTLAYTRSPLPQVAFVAGILLAAMMGFAVYMAETAELRAKALVRANSSLEREIAGRQQAEDALRQAQKMEAVGRLAGGVAHDFNNLLMVIRGHAALSLRNAGVDGSLRRELDEILQATDRASSFTRQLLAFSRKQVLQPRVLDLNALTTQVANMLPPVLGDDIALTIELDPKLGHVKADAALLEQVVMNLVFNARDAMQEGGELTIRSFNADLDEQSLAAHPGAHAGPYVVLAIRDTGHGMSEETQSHIFEPFFTTKDRGKGTGLGLATAYGTVNQSGGFISVASKIGAGTEIRIFLPRVDDPVEVTEIPPAPAEVRRGEGTILVVEDDDAVRRMTREFLKIGGYTVLEARSGADAIQFMERREQPIDLVLTDVLMPGMKGRELVERLAKLRAGIKVLYMSAYTEDAAINIGVLSPGTAFIEKPFSPDDLANKVREVLSAAGNGVGEKSFRHTT
ncbi:MAG TPA: response regulator [Candidatus Acidoferrum sp.]|nr:response regulator [Candidatus Acidoferrum sp.]